MSLAILFLAPLLAASITQQAPTPESLGGQPGQTVACHIEHVSKSEFKSLYQFENQGSSPDNPKYDRIDPVFARLTAVGNLDVKKSPLTVVLLDMINPFGWVAAVDYYTQGTGLTWTPRSNDGKPKGVNFTVLGDESESVMRIRTCSIDSTSQAGHQVIVEVVDGIGLTIQPGEAK